MTRVDADDIRYFHVLATAHTLVRAGQELGVDHTTVGRRISRLEKAVGTRLFARTHTGWKLTPQGERLLPAARLVSLGVGGFAEPDSAQPYPEEWTIVAPDGFASYILGPRCGRLLQESSIVLRVITAKSLWEREGVSYDVAVVRVKPTSSSVQAQLLGSYEIGLYATRSYLEQHPPILRPADLERHVLCWYAEDPLAQVPDYLAMRPVLPQVMRLQCNNLLMHREAAVAGVGISVMPTYVAKTSPDLVRVLPEDIGYRGHYWVVLPTPQLRSEISRKALAFLREAVADAGLTPDPSAVVTD